MAITTESRTGPRAEPRVEKGPSLSRGPALILGTVLLAAGLYFIYKQHYFPKFSNFPSGTATVKGKVLFGLFGGNGWTGMLTAIAGGLLLFGAAQHLLAKTMSLIVGAVLAAAAIIALVDHGNVLGLPSANHLTELAWGIAAAILLINVLLPRPTRTVEPAAAPVGRRGGASGRMVGGAAAGAGAGAVAEHERDRRREPVASEGDRGHGGRHAAEAAAAGAGAGAVAEHEHDKHRQEREAVADQPAADGGSAEQPGPAGQPRQAGQAGQPEPAGQAGQPEQTGQPGASAQPGAGRPEDGAAVRSREPSGGSGGQVGLAERARRWLRPGSGN